jgi:hypothetical protein
MAKTLRTLAWLSCASLVPLGAAAQETPKTVVAAAVRDAGYVCEKPGRVMPDKSADLPDEKAWIILCERGGYRVRFMGDTGPKVEPLSGP